MVSRSSGRRGAAHKRAVYHSSLRHAVSSSSVPESSWRASCSGSVRSSTSICVGRRYGCSAPITRSMPRDPACSRLTVSSASTGCAFLVTRYSRGAWPETAGSSRATRTRRWTWSLRCTSDAPSHVGVSTTTPVNPAGLGSSACCDQHLVTHSAPCRFSASIKRGANSSSELLEVVISSHFPASSGRRLREARAVATRW